jgi:hypothetical protein
VRPIFLCIKRGVYWGRVQKQTQWDMSIGGYKIYKKCLGVFIFNNFFGSYSCEPTPLFNLSNVRY